ncbi:MAG: helix-turn-helix transcriptional regulator [Phycisphaerales bacterium JB063]
MTRFFVLPTPWDGAVAKPWSALRKRIPFDSAALLLTDPARPGASGILGGRKLSSTHLAGWLDASANGDALLQQAARDGQAAPDKPLTSAAAGLPKGLHAAVSAIPNAPGGSLYWVLAVGRKKGGAYTADEHHWLHVALMSIRSRFDAIPENDPGLQRILIDAEGQVMHADTESRLSLPTDLGPLQVLVDEVLEIEAQRWPELKHDAPRDVFPPNGKGPTLWARIERQPDWGKGVSPAICLTLRPIDGLAPPAVGRVEDNRIAQAMGVICDQYAQCPSLNDLAAQFEISPFHFHRLFSSQAEISPKHLALRVQLLHARHMLRTTTVPIRDVADLCGFSSHGHFSATFHRMVGLTPADYRLGTAPPR